MSTTGAARLQPRYVRPSDRPTDRALSPSTFGPRGLELVLVADSCGDEARAVAERLSSVSHFPLPKKSSTTSKFKRNSSSHHEPNRYSSASQRANRLEVRGRVVLQVLQRAGGGRHRGLLQTKVLLPRAPRTTSSFDVVRSKFNVMR